MSGKVEEASIPKVLQVVLPEEPKGARKEYEEERKEYEERPVNSPEDRKKRVQNREEVKEVVDQGFNP